MGKFARLHFKSCQVPMFDVGIKLVAPTFIATTLSVAKLFHLGLNLMKSRHPAPRIRVSPVLLVVFLRRKKMSKLFRSLLATF